MIIIVVVVVVVVVLNTLIYTWTKVWVILEMLKNKSIRLEMKSKNKGIQINN